MNDQQSQQQPDQLEQSQQPENNPATSTTSNSAEGHSPADIHDLALATIDQLNQFEKSPDRARHKLNMIRIAEQSAVNADRQHANLEPKFKIDHDDALRTIIAAAEWCESRAA